MKRRVEIQSSLRDVQTAEHQSFGKVLRFLALQELPAVNAEIYGDQIVYKNYYDIGVAVGTPQGLVVPVLRNADAMSFADIDLSLIVSKLRN